MNTDSGRGRRRWLLTGVGAAAMASGMGWAWLRLQPQPAPSAAVTALFGQTFNDAQGRPQALEQWRGQWLVVNFWATWCAPCVEEMPMLQKVALEYRGKGVTVIGLGIDTAAAIQRFQKELQLELPLLVAGATGSELARQLGNPSGALPYTVLVSPAGAVEQARLGLLSETLLRSWLDGRV